LPERPPGCSHAIEAGKGRIPDGADFLHAFIVGTEVEDRLGNTIYPSHYDMGWHITGTCGVFGAAAACGRILGLNREQMMWALGLAATQASGVVTVLLIAAAFVPAARSRLQDFFGMSRGPSICNGRLPLTLHLLAPSGRAQQVTQDLAGFWERHYPAIRRELMRKYPRHAWPEDGARATPPAPRR